MLKQYKDFDVKHFTKTFNSNKYYNGRLNGFDVVVIQNHEDADKLIQYLKNIIDSYSLLELQNLELEYDDSYLLKNEQLRVKEEIKKYISQKI